MILSNPNPKSHRGLAVTTSLAALAMGSIVAWGSNREGAKSHAPSTLHPEPTVAPRADFGNRNETLSVSGRVLDAQGKPLSGAAVTLENLRATDLEAPKVRALSDREGRFRFAIDPSELVRSTTERGRDVGPLVSVIVPGEGIAWNDTWDMTGPVGIELRFPSNDVPILGQIVDLEGRAIAGVRVHVLQIDARPDGDLTHWLEELAGRPSGFRAFEGFKSTLPPSVCRLIPPTSTDSEGRFRLSGLGRERLVSLVIEGPTIETQLLNVMTRPGSGVSFPLPRSAGSGNGLTYPHRVHSSGFRFAAAPTCVVEGVVRDIDSGQSLTGVVIRADVEDRNAFPKLGHPWFDWPGAFMRATTDASGHYRLAGLPAQDPVTLRADPGDDLPYHSASRSFSNRPSQGKTAVDISLKHGVLVRGQALDGTTGRPVVGLVEYAPTLQNENNGDTSSRQTAPPRQIGPDGRFSVVARSGPGVVGVRAFGDRFVTADLVEDGPKRATTPFPRVVGGMRANRCHAFTLINPKVGVDSNTDTLVLTPGRTPEVRVLDPEGLSLSGASVGGMSNVEYYREGWWQARERSAFLLRGLTTRHIRAIPFHHEARRLVGTLAVRDNERGPLTVRLRPWGTVKGTLIGRDGRPSAGVALSCHGLWTDVRVERVDFPRDATTDPQGRFVLEGFVPGVDYRLRIAKAKSPDASVGDVIRLRAGESKDIGEVRESAG
ncbi:carboxypeptidase regulatory-like domain-containing protein [Singulisphaera rosea]